MPLLAGLQDNVPFDAEAPAAGPMEWPRLTDWMPERWPVADDWRPLIEHFLASEAGRQLACFMRARLAQGAIIYPAQPFRALALTSLAQSRIVMLGQDPYHRPGQAQGLAFSVPPGVSLPPSLRNIFGEIARDPVLGRGAQALPTDGSLVRWAQQGVLLLNTCLTVEAGRPASHAQHGWEALTDAIVEAVSRKNDSVVFMLWGAHAQAKQGLIAADGTDPARPKVARLVLMANHPSPLSARRPPRPFIGCGHFGLANAFLRQHGCLAVDW